MIREMITVIGCCITTLVSATVCNDDFKITNKSIEIKETYNDKEENAVNTIKVIVGDKTFNATLYDNETTKEFIDMLPITINMEELNNNEKYYYLENSIKTNSYCPKNIEAGDIMLYGSNCLVIFYESFSTSYSYTPIGKIDNQSELSEALGAGDVEVIFEK